MTLKNFIYEFWLFGLKQAQACVFGGFLLAIMILTHFWYPFENLARYDFIFLCAVAFQVFLILFKFETKREMIVILVFHIVATIMELFKTSDLIKSWKYPENFIFGIYNVPLFAGFMYSAVGSYLARIWRLFDFKFTNYPKIIYTIILVSLIYINFFTHHFIFDFRFVLILATIIIFFKTKIHFKVFKKYRSMYLLVGWLPVAFFIWIAENIATYLRVWLYPSQVFIWSVVPVSKLFAWYLLMLLSFVLVSLVHKPQKFEFKK